MHSRAFAGPADLIAMQQVIVAARRASPHSGSVHIGDLNWWCYYLSLPYAWEQHATLWTGADGRVVGWSLFSPAYGAFDLFVLPAVRRSPDFDTLLDRTIQRMLPLARAHGQTSLRTMWVFQDDACWIAHLERRGFAPDPTYSLHYLLRALDTLPAPRVLPGFALRPLAGHEIEARAAAHRAAFRSRRMTAEAYRHLMRAPEYRRDLDHVAVAPDGRIAAFALAWLDATTRAGEFEPVGTHPAFRGQGLGRAVVLAGLHRLRALGAEHAIVYAEDDNPAAQRLYVSLGFRPANHILAYVRPLD